MYYILRGFYWRVCDGIKQKMLEGGETLVLVKLQYVTA